jgi:HAD superfamily hydrolase (TIGR01549 family)
VGARPPTRPHNAYSTRSRVPRAGLSSWPPDIDTDPARHRDAYFQVFRDAEIDQDLARELYAVESDPNYNPFAQYVGPALQTIKNSGVRIVVLSDIHVDIRSAFERAGLLSLIDLFVLSFEHGVQKPRPEMFQLALEGLNLPASQVLMVGDRAAHDGAAVGEGMVTLLLPALRSITDCRLHLVTALLG